MMSNKKHEENILTTWYVAGVYPKSFDDCLPLAPWKFFAYTDNEFVVNQFVRCTAPLISGLAIGDEESVISTWKYDAFDDDELFLLVGNDLDIRMNGNDRLEIFPSDLNPEIALYLTANYFDGEDADVMGDFSMNFYINRKMFSIMNDVMILPEEVKKMLKLFDDVYMLLIHALYVTDVYSFEESEFKRNTIELLKSKGRITQQDSEPMFCIFDILDETIIRITKMKNMGFWFDDHLDREEGD